MAMDRAEKLGLGAALGGHGLLLGAFALGLLAAADTGPKQEAISVSLVGEVADVSSAPDAIQEESAPPAPGDTAPAEPPPAPTAAMQIERPVEKPQAEPIPQPAKPNTAPPVAKVAAKKEPVKQPPATAAAKPVKTAAATPKTGKAAAVSGKGTTPAKPGGLSRSFEDSISNIGKAPGAGKAVGTPAAKSAAQVRSAVNASLGPQIMRFVRSCSPNGLDVDKIATSVTLSLNIDGSLDGMSAISQRGVNENNRPQAKPTEQCVVSAIRQAQPFKGLDREYYDMWKSHRMTFQPN